MAHDRPNKNGKFNDIAGTVIGLQVIPYPDPYSDPDSDPDPYPDHDP